MATDRWPCNRHTTTGRTEASILCACKVIKSCHCDISGHEALCTTKMFLPQKGDAVYALAEWLDGVWREGGAVAGDGAEAS